MNILILEPFHTGSHADWANGYAARSGHDIEILGLEGRHWKWRMHGGAVALARRFLESNLVPDLIVASDMLDLTTFLALTRGRTAASRTAVYFHENQLTYPWSGRDEDPSQRRDAHYGFINYSSALAADIVLFNSRYHRDAFLAALEPFLGGFPDHRGIDSVDVITKKSEILPLGLDLTSFDAHRPACERTGKPLVLWNHRWEYDKNPEEFFYALFALADENIDYNIVVLGEKFDEAPDIFREARSRLGDRIAQFGYESDFASYAGWLHRADILPVTSIHDFFGASVVQAIYCDCYPLLPKRLAYPEHIPPARHGEFFYDDTHDLIRRLRECMNNIETTRRITTRDFVLKYDWAEMAPLYDAVFHDCVLLLE